MFKLIKAYQDYFTIHNAKGIFKKIFFSFMLILPHILTCLILIILYPYLWIGIIIVGLVLPDLSYFFHLFIHPAAMFKGNFELLNMAEKRKTIAHILTFVIIIFLLINKQYVLFFAGGIHLFLDMLGF